MYTLGSKPAYILLAHLHGSENSELIFRQVPQDINVKFHARGLRGQLYEKPEATRLVT